MYLDRVAIKRFRLFKVLDLTLNRGLNVLVGENDSGKTAIIDAIKLALDTHSSEWVRLSHEDFHEDASRLRIECKFTNRSGHRRSQIGISI